MDARFGFVSGRAAIADSNTRAASRTDTLPPIRPPFRPEPNDSVHLLLDVSPQPLLPTTHDCGPLWAGYPSAYDSYIHDTSPVYPGVRRNEQCPTDFFQGL